ncbi:hypothetical protein BL05031 [Bacillus licheniformis DSM 13 = ATCC 14580]|uniref:Uncharacterized protein n=1 Tax=Bacillus licheniformis (strain ATCC 14580 / DSM 13 / JCM 2505 / CCUG 7422 / NBRC 12200 / NCIMB 9375 / NCTC 10341 / NRRL NRS-1264 / Gibson 46) TaxID=279010 RepID=Q62YP2_BACLD|nr:hypothetical protein BL05031 [Bacillus licheniformis DSM 13 = ATCC 14580]
MENRPALLWQGNFSEVEHSRKTKHDISIFSFALSGLRKELMYNQ